MSKREQKKRISMWMAAVIFMAALVLMQVAAFPQLTKAEQVTEIWTYEDLLKIAENPSGDYRLMTDIDLKGKTWTPVDFTGNFEGNGFAILNATINSVGPQTFATYDGNMIPHDTRFAAFFSSLTNGAVVRDLNLLGINVDVNSQEAVFAAGLAGYMDTGSVADCTLYGSVTAHSTGDTIGVGGVAGFGNGVIAGTKSNMTLICVDDDVEYKDEQFLGGAYASGYIDLANNSIQLDAYDSDHGYVHNGGLVGMYILYPEDNGYSGYIVDNNVSGQITFFEDNEDRRAYCEADIGEVMNWNFMADDTFSNENFTGNEVFEYDTVLMPHYCENPKWETTVVEGTETDYGYTEYRCAECGYTYRADFTPRAKSSSSGSGGGEIESASAAANDKGGGGKVSVILIIAIIVFVIAIALLTFFLIRRSKLEKQRQEERRQDRDHNPRNRR